MFTALTGHRGLLELTGRKILESTGLLETIQLIRNYRFFRITILLELAGRIDLGTLTRHAGLLELAGRIGLLELTVRTILSKLTERTGLRASTGPTYLLEKQDVQI